MKNKTTKRNYTKRGTTVAGKRVVLIDGTPVGRGRPSKDGKGNRTVVFIPVGESYDVAKHGLGVRYNHAFHGVLKRLKNNTPSVASESVEVVTPSISTPENTVEVADIAPVTETPVVETPVETVENTVVAAEAPVGATDKW